MIYDKEKSYKMKRHQKHLLDLKMTEIEERYKYGVLVKKEKIRKLIINQWHDGYVTRTIAKEWTEKMNYSQNNVNTIFSKFLN